MKSIFYCIVTLLDGRHNRKHIASFGIDSLVMSTLKGQTGWKTGRWMMPGH